MSDTINGHDFEVATGCCSRCGYGYATCKAKACTASGFIDADEVYVPAMTFARFQNEHRAWAEKNFGKGGDEVRISRCFIGLTEELGELGHALLKQAQGIRGTHAEHEAAGKDAIFDMLAYMTDLCNRKGWSLKEIVETGWAEVGKRDWQKNKETGGAT